MDKALTLRILTPDGPVFDGPVEAAFLPGSGGPFEVLPGHAPIISSLEAGSVVWRAGGKEQSVVIRNGSAILDKGVIIACVQLG